jgi:hypothetical protein
VTRLAAAQVDAFGARFGDAHVRFACQAAVPLALTPDLAYRLWDSFHGDAAGEPLRVPWVAIPDLLLSPLCQEIGPAVYQMDRDVRGELLRRLRADERLGLARLREVAEFLQQFYERAATSEDPDLRLLAEAQHDAALSVRDGAAAVSRLTARMSRLGAEDAAEWIRQESLVEAVGPLFAAGAPPELVEYAGAMAAHARGGCRPSPACAYRFPRRSRGRPGRHTRRRRPRSRSRRSGSCISRGSRWAEATSGGAGSRWCGSSTASSVCHPSPSRSTWSSSPAT